MKKQKPSITESDLHQLIADKTGVTKVDVSKVLGAFTDVSARKLKSGVKIKLRNFCTLTPYNRKARIGRNPSTGKPMSLPSKNTVKMKVMPALEEYLN